MQAATAVKPSTSPAARRRTSSWMCWVSKGSEQLSFKISMHGKNCMQIDFLHTKENANYSWVIYYFISVLMNWLILLSHCALQSLQLSEGPALPKTSQPLSHRRSAWSAGWKECPSPPFSGTKTGSKCLYFTPALRHERLNKLILKNGLIFDF